MIKKAKVNSIYSSTCETISVVSGKGGTGKTFIVSCLAYTLQNAGQRVCLIDTDFATQGLSLFILGRGAERGTSKLAEENSLYHMVKNWNESSSKLPMPKEADRSQDHGVQYKIILSNKQFYDRRLSLGVKKDATIARSILNESMGETSDQFRNNYRVLIRSLLQKLTKSESFDYILIDTRGGFGELSLASVVFSDSFLIVTEPDFTSFHQLAKLLTNIDLMAQQENTQPYIRGVIVNKAIDGEEEKFRSLLDSQFGIEFGLSWSIPLDQDAIHLYKNQLIPYLSLPRSKFSYTTLNAFTEIFDIVTVEWTKESKNKWHDLLKNVKTAKKEEQKRIKAGEDRTGILAVQADEEIKKAKYAEEEFRLKMESLEKQDKEKKEQYEKTEKDIDELRNELKKTELRGVKKSITQKMLLIILGTLVIFFTALNFFTYREKIMMQNKLQDVETQMLMLSDVRMEITTTPSQATVFIDGKGIGTTPFLTDVSPGRHQLRLEKKGYLTYSEEFDAIPSPRTIRRHFELRPIVKK